MKGFGWRLENLREKIGYSKKEMSLKLGFTANVYGQYERGERRPTLETIIDMAEIFNVSLDYLIRGKEYNKEVTSSQSKQELLEIADYVEKQGINKVNFFDSKKWSLLSKEDIKEINNHFEWVAHKAELRSKQTTE